MIQTAIIALLLIGAMLLFTACGDSETKEVTKVEVDKDGIPKYVTEKSHDLSYDERDSEIAAASYVKDNVEEGSISHDSNGVHYSLATKDINNGIRTSQKERDKEVKLAAYDTTAKVKEEGAEKQKVVATKIETKVEKVPVKEEPTVKEEPVVKKNMTEKVGIIEIPKVVDVVKVAVVAPVAAVVLSAIKVEELETPVKDNEVKLPSSVTTDEVKVAKKEEVIAPKVKTNVEQVPVKEEPKVENIEKVVMATADIKEEESEAPVSIELTVPLASDIVVPEVKMSVTSDETTPEVDSTVNFSLQAITIPAIPSVPEVKVIVPTALKSKSMEEFSSNSQAKKDLNLERTAKEEAYSKMNKLLAIVEDATEKTESAYLLEHKKLEEIIVKEKALTSKNVVLEEKIVKLLSIVEEATKSVDNQLENKADEQKVEALLSTTQNLEKNLFSSHENEKLVIEKNIALKEKIEKLLSIVKDATENVTVEFETEKQKMQGLLSEKEKLETSLIAELEKEKRLEEINKELSVKISKLLTIAEEGTAKAEVEYKTSVVAMQRLLSEKENLATNLTTGLEKEKHLEEINKELSVKISELLAIAEDGTSKAEVEYKTSVVAMQKLLSEKENLETSLTTEVEKEKHLEEINNELSVKISELLTIAEDGIAKAEAEYKISVVDMEKLLSEKENLETNLTAEVEKEKHLAEINTELSVKISELLSIAKNGTAKAETEHNISVAKMQGLLSIKEGLEGNVSKLKATNDELSLKITELLSIAKQGTEKAEVAYKVEQEKIQGLLSTKESLEANLTTEQEHEKLLTEENIALQAKIAKLLSIAKEGTEKATLEQEAEKEKMKELLFTKEGLEGNVSKLKATNDELSLKITELLSIAEEGTKKAILEQEAEKKKMKELLFTKESLEGNVSKLKETNDELASTITELLSIAEKGTEQAEVAYKVEKENIQGLLSTKESLETNLTLELENEKILVQENIGLNEKIFELLAIAKDATEKAKSEQDSKNQEFQKLLSSKEGLETNLTVELEHEKILSEENLKLKEQLALLVEEKAIAEKAEAERVAAEEAAKAEAEAKAKEEEERIAAEKEAEEKAAAEKAIAEKAEAKRVAAEEAEKKLTDAFSLTKVKFKTGSMQLTNESKKRLKDVVSVMQKYEGYSYKIQGHTDNRGNENFNIRLSGKRANAVKLYLVSQGIDAGVLSTEGFGSANPIASNDTREGRVQNRRVVFEIVK